MSILTQTVQKPSDSEKLEKISNIIKTSSARAYKELVQIQKTGIDYVWNNREFSPQQIIDALGDNAIKIFNIHGKLTEYLIEISAIDGVDYVPALPTNAFIVEDGKITVTDLPYIP